MRCTTVRTSLRTPLAVLLVGATVLAACGDDGADEPVLDTSPPPTQPPAPTTTAAAGDDSAAALCAADAGTVTDGVLTIATGEFAYPPYVLDDAPESKQGFEAAVAYAVADQLGYADDQVTWVRTGFDEVIAPGSKDFDFNLQQYTITEARSAVVDFSEGYYTAAQAILGYEDSAAAGATSVADLKGLKIGVQVGTTSLEYIESAIQPDEEPLVYDTNADAKAALDANQIDAIVADLPTALYITAVEIEGTTVFGQIEGSGTDEFGLLLAKDSPLTECVDLALQALKADGTLDTITTEWMSEWSEAPVIAN